MNYEEAVKFYYDAGKFRHEPGLEPMRKLCRALGDPQKDLRFIHIAGTNGKGSCAAMLASVLQCSGQRVGLYTSPDLVDFAERIQINGVYIKHSDLARLTARVADAAETVGPLSFFELVTACAFLYFKEQRCDIVVLECGLGGKYDATNIIEVPEACVIMPIGLDHTAVLGGTLAEIAGEKAGIIKENRPLICAGQEAEAKTVIAARCAELDAPMTTVDIKSIYVVKSDITGQTFHYGDMKNIHLSLLGPHQLENAAAVIETAKILGVGDTAIRRGLAESVWPCRLECARIDPPFFLDGAHNPHGAKALAESLKQLCPGQKFCFILGVLADKDWRELWAELAPLAERVLCVTPPDSRALEAEDLARSIEAVPAEACRDLNEALEKALASALPCCACGSLYYIGLLRQILLDGA